MKMAKIQPTGNELLAGIIEDTDSPMAAGVLKDMGYCVETAAPLPDSEEAISSAIRNAAEKSFSLLVLIGGSGGGHAFDPALARDCTHGAMDSLLEPKSAVSLYGKNGHLWSRLVCGFYRKMLVINLPGPFDEAGAAIRAFSEAGSGASCEEISHAMAEAVKQTYFRR